MRTDPFYTLLAQVGFTLLSFWLVVAELRGGHLLRTVDRRRMAHAISLQFALPGVMSLLSLAAPDNAAVWRTSFVLAAGVGAGALFALRRPGAPPLVAAAFWAAVALYALVALVAVAARDLDAVGITLRPLEVEGVLLSLLVFLGLNVAFGLLFAPRDEQT